MKTKMKLMNHKKILIELVSATYDIQFLQNRNQLLLAYSPEHAYQVVDIQLKNAIYHLNTAVRALKSFDLAKRVNT